MAMTSHAPTSSGSHEHGIEASSLLERISGALTDGGAMPARTSAAGVGSKSSSALSVVVVAASVNPPADGATVGARCDGARLELVTVLKIVLPLAGEDERREPCGELCGDAHALAPGTLIRASGTWMSAGGCCGDGGVTSMLRRPISFSALLSCAVSCAISTSWRSI